MLKQSENKASTKPGQEDVFTAMSGRKLRRADVENPSRPGYLKDELVPIPPDAWSAGVFFDLLTPTGRRMRPIHPTADPREPRREEAPENLRRDLEKAEVVLERHRKTMLGAVDGLHEAQIAQQRAASRQDRRAYTAAIAGEQEARERYKTLCEEERPLIKHAADAERSLKHWLDVERINRFEGAERPQPVF